MLKVGMTPNLKNCFPVYRNESSQRNALIEFHQHLYTEAPTTPLYADFPPRAELDRPRQVPRPLPRPPLMPAPTNGFKPVTCSASQAHSALAAFRRAAAPAAPFGSVAANADAACASFSLAPLAAREASASAVSVAMEQSQHFREESGFRACVLVKLLGGRFCLQMLQGSGSPSALSLPLRASYALHACVETFSRQQRGWKDKPYQ